jgi:hypothetical protein
MAASVEIQQATFPLPVLFSPEPATHRFVDLPEAVSLPAIARTEGEASAGYPTAPPCKSSLIFLVGGNSITCV